MFLLFDWRFYVDFCRIFIYVFFYRLWNVSKRPKMQGQIWLKLTLSRATQHPQARCYRRPLLTFTQRLMGTVKLSWNDRVNEWLRQLNPNSISSSLVAALFSIALGISSLKVSLLSGHSLRLIPYLCYHFLP